MQPNKSSASFVAIIFAACAIATLIYYIGFPGGAPDVAKKTEMDAGEAGDAPKHDNASSEATVDLTPDQVNTIKIEPVGTYSFRMEKEAVGSVAYHEQDSAQKLPWMDGSTPAPVTTSQFIVANVPENASPLIHEGQPVRVKMAAYPDRVFEGKVSAVGVTIYDSGGNPAIDPSTHRIAVRCEIADPKNELYPGMLATVVIQVEDPVTSAAIPANGIVRKGDGTMTAWVTKDRKRFEERTVKVGLQQDGYDQILEGLKPDELVATDGAVFISNILYAPPSD